MVIKHVEGNNQAMAWKFCVVEQNVQCWKKTKQKGPVIKEKIQPKKDHQMATRSLGQKIKCCSQEDRNAGFKCFKSHWTQKVKTLKPEHTSIHHIRQHDISGRGSWCGLLILAGPIRPSKAMLGLWIKTCLQQTVWAEQQKTSCGTWIRKKTLVMEELTTTKRS